MNARARRALLDEFLSRARFETYLRLRGVRLRGEGDHLCGRCPLQAHDGQDAASFKLWPHQGHGGRFYCRGCRCGGDVLDFVRRQQGVGFTAALRHVSRITGTPLPPELGVDPLAVTLPDPDEGAPADGPVPAGADDDWQVSEDNPWAIDLPAAALLTEAYMLECRRCLLAAEGREARAWLHRCGLGDEVLQRYHLGFAPAAPGVLGREVQLARALGLLEGEQGADQAVMAGRIIFPVITQKVVAGFYARLPAAGFRCGQRLSRRSALFDPQQLVYGLDEAQQHLQDHGGGRLHLAADVMGVLTAAQAGQAAVSGLGLLTAHLTGPQRQAITAMASRQHVQIAGLEPL